MWEIIPPADIVPHIYLVTKRLRSVPWLHSHEDGHRVLSYRYEGVKDSDATIKVSATKSLKGPKDQKDLLRHVSKEQGGEVLCVDHSLSPCLWLEIAPIYLYFIIDFYKSLSTADGERVFEARVITSFTDFDQQVQQEIAQANKVVCIHSLCTRHHPILSAVALNSQKDP